MDIYVRVPYLTHNDDGKGKYQSHTVGCCTTDDWLSNIEGYGSTREEAFDEFKKKLNERLAELCVLCNQVNRYEFNAASNPIAMYSVDWRGNIMDE